MNTTPVKPKILLVDDEESIRISGKYSLDSWYDVTTTDKSSTALQLLEKEKFDLVLLDILIKGEGEEGSLNAIKTINEKYPNLPVVMLSGSVIWVQRWPELRKIGAYGYLSKPFERYRAKEIIEKCLKGERFDNVQH